MSNKILFIGDDVNYGASKSSTSANAASSPHDLRAGALGWFDASDNTLITGSTNPTDTPKIYLARGVNNSIPVRTPVIDARDVVGWNGQAFNSGQIARRYVGYTGSGSLSINLKDSADYGITVEYVNNPQYARYWRAAFTKSQSTANGFDIVRELARQLFLKPHSANIPYLDKDVEKIVIPDVVAETSSAQLVDSVPSNVTATVTHGSRTIELSADTSGGSTVVTAGDTLRIGHATDTSYPVYLVEEVSGNTTVTLDRAYAGDSASGVAMGYISGKPADADNVGLELEGENAGLEFSIGLSGDGFEGTQVTNDQRPIVPVNSGDKIVKLEEDLLGKEGRYQRVWIPPEFPKFADSTINYDTYRVSLEGGDLQEMGRISGPSSPLRVIIAVPDSPSTFTNSDFEVINNWFNAAPLNFANVTL